ncbi:MAG: gamma-glutamylcyclotransferase family protein [Leptospiraceae bacterium]
MHTVFVYGTLKRGFRLHHYMKGCDFLGEGFLDGYRLHRITWYPAIRPAPESRVFGELFQVAEKHLDILDEVEDRGILYERYTETVHLLTNPEVHADSQILAAMTANDPQIRSLSAFVYVYMHPLDGGVIEDGRFTLAHGQD